MRKKKLMFMLHERHFCLQIFKNFQKLVKERKGNSIFEIGRRWLCSSTIKLQNWNYYAQFGSSGKQLNTHCKRKHNLNLCPAFGSGTTSSACKVRRIFYCRVETRHCMTLHDIAWQARYVITRCKFKLQPFNGNKDNVYLQQNNTSLEGINMAFQGSAHIWKPGIQRRWIQDLTYIWENDLSIQTVQVPIFWRKKEKL